MSIILEIRKKIRFLILVFSIVIATFFLIIYAHLYEPVLPLFDFYANVSFPLLLTFTSILAVLGLYLLILHSRQTLRIIKDYSSQLDKLMNVSKDLREEMYSDILLEKIMDYSMSITGSDAGSLLLMDDSHRLVFNIIRGPKASRLLGTSLEPGKGLAGWAAEKGSSLRVNDVSKDARFSPEYDSGTGYQTRSIMCVPLKTKDRVIGVLVLLNKKNELPYSERDEEIITYLASQAAISILKTRFAEDQKNYEIHLTEILLDAIDSLISNKRGHSKRVAKFCSIIAKAVNLPEEDQKRLFFASLLHDIGFLKLNIDEIFDKHEYMKHPVVGYELIKPINFYVEIAPIILHHHERYDGHGYPSQIGGDAIPVESRIIHIAEAFDAMTSPLSYKIPMRFEDAIDELQRHAGTQFDPDLVRIFSEHITHKHME
ncbi:MAG: GAF domain-containing protein [Nitrospirota bacterium]|nr:GAF domain-containing protein [Nitrospirota bacterium]